MSEITGDAASNDLFDTERVEINLCIGLFGVCVIGLIGDESEGVNTHIDVLGVEDWYAQLPEHDHPIEGVYSIVCDVIYGGKDLAYTIVSIQEDNKSSALQKIASTKDADLELGRQCAEEMREIARACLRSSLVI